MLERKKTILFITKSKIKIVNVALGGKVKEDIIAKADWIPETLADILFKYKKNIKEPIRILLSEDFVYTVSLDVPLRSYLRDDIKKRAQELIPENLDETVWDFREVREVGDPPKIQVVAVAKVWFGFVASAIAKAGIHIEAIEPLSLSLARVGRKEDKPLLFVYIDDDEILLTLAQRGIVIETERLSSIDLNKINQFIAFARKRFSIDPKDVVFCGEALRIDLANFQSANFKAQIKNISPIVSLANKEDLKGKDEEVLNLELLKPSMTKNGKKHNFLKITIASIFILLIIAIVGGYFFFQGEREANQTTSKPTQTDSPRQTRLTPTVTPGQTRLTPSAQVDFASYTIRVLNGSQTEGEAARLENILKDNSFSVVEIGNADSSTYEKTEIHNKEKVPREVILALDKIINTLYDFSISADLEEDSKTDIVIIIGSASK